MAKLTLSFRSKPINAYFFEIGQSISIGRDEENDIFIDSLAIAPIHAKFTFSDSGATVEPADDSSIVHVNGAKITTSELQHGDRIEIGKHTLEYSEEKPAIEIQSLFSEAEPEVTEEQDVIFKSKSRTGKLQVLRGSKAGHVIPLNDSVSRIGKKTASEVEFVKCSDGYYLSVLKENKPGSVKLNNETLHKQTLKIKNGDSLKIDNTELLFFEQ
ncbi:MAG: FHA domain-containing protein [Gammaproteobacteria bacterium]|nr:FHA domain-containing protein [Gammaproteobacteria bacterium]